MMRRLIAPVAQLVPCVRVEWSSDKVAVVVVVVVAETAVVFIVLTVVENWEANPS
jgi:hypothetical protein